MPQLEQRATRWAVWRVTCLMLWFVCCGASDAFAQASKLTSSSALYLRTDTNSTTVWSPRASASGTLSDLTLQAAYAVDAWTSASVDIVTAATQAVHEVRQEVNANVSYQVEQLRLSASYRYSTENDYWSHGGVLQAALDLAQRNTTLALALFGSRDTVGRALDNAFRKQQQSLGARLTLTQILDRAMWLQVGWESAFVDGFQASPYRFVAIGGLGTCHSQALYCVREYVPEQRLRQAATLHLKRALGNYVSLELDYRYYFDSWHLHSQTIAPGIALLVGAGTLSLSYRYYTQGEASFYRPRYLRSPDATGYVTRDKELSALYSQRLSLQYVHDLALWSPGHVLALGARISLSHFRYLAFVGLSQVDALEATVSLGYEWR